jgi:predicted MFS family arabinose efflux permease
LADLASGFASRRDYNAMLDRDSPPVPRLRASLVILIAFACGAMVANLYYAQTLLETIGPEIGLSRALYGTIVTLTQLGYGAGLLFIVPLGDLFENKRLALLMTGGTFVGCLAIARSTGPATFLGASLFTGICATGAQILLPLASHLSSRERQGRIIGQVMSGLLAGIMLARPLASFIAERFGWRYVFYVSAALIAAIAVALMMTLPSRRPTVRRDYAGILTSLLSLTLKHRALRLRAL